MNYVLFDDAFVINGKVEDEERHAAKNAISYQSESCFVVRASETPIAPAQPQRKGQPPQQSGEVGLQLVVYKPVQEAVQVLEVCFPRGKQMRTKFGVEYITLDDKKVSVGVFESTGRTTNYEKFKFDKPISDFKGIVLTFKGNDDRSPYFMIKGVRMAKEVQVMEKGI